MLFLKIIKHFENQMLPSLHHYQHFMEKLLHHISLEMTIAVNYYYNAPQMVMQQSSITSFLDAGPMLHSCFHKNKYIFFIVINFLIPVSHLVIFSVAVIVHFNHHCLICGFWYITGDTLAMGDRGRQNLAYQNYATQFTKETMMQSLLNIADISVITKDHWEWISMKFKSKYTKKWNYTLICHLQNICHFI